MDWGLAGEKLAEYMACLQTHMRASTEELAVVVPAMEMVAEAVRRPGSR